MTPSPGALARAHARLTEELGEGQARLDGGALIVLPRDAGEVALAVRVATAERLPIQVKDRIDSDETTANFGGPSEGSGMGSARGSDRVLIDSTRLSALLDLDESSLLVRAQAGMRFDALASRLSAAGMTLGPLAPHSLGRTLGALLADPRPSEATPRGRFVDLCAAVEAVLPDGTVITTRLAPRKATGPDFLQALIGARGETGIITSAWLRAARRPPRRAFSAFGFSDGMRALSAARAILDRGGRPADLAVVDHPVEGLDANEVLLALHLDGAPEMVAAEEALATEMVRLHHGRSLAAPIAEGWLVHPRPVLMQLQHESFVPMASLPARFAERRRPAVLVGFRPAGAALLSSGPHLETAPAEAASALRGALARGLDPAGLFSRTPTRDGGD